MEVCYPNVGLVQWWAGLSPEGQAGWLSAIGGLAAVFLTMTFYFLDRWRERQLRGRESRMRLDEEARARASRQSGRAASAWKQAIMLRPILVLASARMGTMKTILERDAGVSEEEKPLLLINDLERFAAMLTDSSAFNPDTERRLLEFIAYGSLQNTLLDLCLRPREGGGYTVRPAIAGEKGSTEVSKVKELSDQLIADLDHIIVAGNNSNASRSAAGPQ